MRFQKKAEPAYCPFSCSLSRLRRHEGLGLAKGFFVHLARHGLTVARAHDEPRVLQLLEMVRKGGAGNFQFLARARESLQDPVAALVHSVPFPQELEEHEPLLAGKGLKDFNRLKEFHGYRIV
jgi:hypothetical protein